MKAADYRHSVTLTAEELFGEEWREVVEWLNKQHAPRRDDAGKPGDAPAPYREPNERITSRST